MTATPLRDRPAWKALEKHHGEIRDVHLRDLFADDPTRGERLAAEGAGLYLDYSKNRITDETLRLLLQLAEESGLAERTEAMFRGDRINVSENRSVLHVALRMPKGSSLVVDGVDVVANVHEVLDRMAAFADRVRSGEWKGHTGKPIRNVVNVDIDLFLHSRASNAPRTDNSVGGRPPFNAGSERHLDCSAIAGSRSPVYPSTEVILVGAAAFSRASGERPVERQLDSPEQRCLSIPIHSTE